MVSTRRGTSGTNPLAPPTGTREENFSRGPDQSTPSLLPPSSDPSLPGSSRGPQPTVTLTLEELRRFMMDCQKQAFAEARAEVQAQSMAPPSDTRAPSTALPRPPPPTPALERRSMPRREGPTDSTGQTPLNQSQRRLSENRGAPMRTEAVAPSIPQRTIPQPIREEVAESTCREEVRRPRPPAQTVLPEEVQREPENLRPELEEVSQQILRLSRRVEDLARVENRPEASGVPRVAAPTAHYEGSNRIRRERASPFCDEIARERVVGNSTVPTSLPRYDGMTDPMQHLLKFEHLMELHGHSSNIYAKMLVTTFQDLALEWFTRLEPRSIFSYEQLTEKFLRQFASKRRARLPYTNLYAVRQGEGESTRDFMERFNNEVLKVETPTVDFLTDVLYFGLRNKALAGALAREKPRTMERLLALTDSYVEEEEMSKLKYGGERKSRRRRKETRLQPE